MNKRLRAIPPLRVPLSGNRTCVLNIDQFGTRDPWSLGFIPHYKIIKGHLSSSVDFRPSTGSLWNIFSVGHARILRIRLHHSPGLPELPVSLASSTLWLCSPTGFCLPHPPEVVWGLRARIASEPYLYSHIYRDPCTLWLWLAIYLLTTAIFLCRASALCLKTF